LDCAHYLSATEHKVELGAPVFCTGIPVYRCTGRSVYDCIDDPKQLAGARRDVARNGTISDRLNLPVPFGL
jgi:hypothetical protein